MAGLIDYEAVLADFERFLVEDGRKSQGVDFLTRKLAELRVRHTIDQDAERTWLRRVSADLQDSFLGLLPAPATSDDPLTAGDPRARAAMDDGAAIPSESREASCKTPPTHPPSPSSPTTPGSPPSARHPAASPRAAAMSC